jgi:hypothetical protein
LLAAGTAIADVESMQHLEEDKEPENMAATRVDEDQHLREVLTAGPDVFGALALGRNAPASATAAAGVGTWLAAPRTILLFRTTRWATFAGLQIARRGYVAAIYQKYLIVEAPWLLVCALVARIGLGREVLNIRWESDGPWGWSTDDLDVHR